MNQNLSPAHIRKSSVSPNGISSGLGTTQNTEAMQHHLNFSVVNLPESSNEEPL